MESGVQVDSPTIKAINKGVVHRICSGQVILDLSSAVKELVENSLDAGATSIEVSLKDYGEKWFKVIDNGCGISPKNFKVLALKHHTSKITDFPDLQSLTTFGFRGEALSSLCALGNLTVETRTKNEPVATHLTFDHSGLLTSERKTARQVGTTVCIEKLFSCLPVRSKEFSRNIRKEYGKLISLLNAYALIAKGVRFVCTNTTGKNGKSVVLQTQGSNSIKDNIITLFGMNTFTCLEPLSMHVSESCLVEGFLSKPGHGSGRNLGDRQFFFVNGRPVDMPKVTKVVNELYKSANSRQYPIAILNFTISTKTYDVNVTPDKRKIFFSDEGSLMHSLKEAIEKIYSPNQCSYIANKLEEPKKKKSGSELSPCHEERQASLKQSPSEGCSNMEVEYVEERNLEEKHKDNGDPPIEIKKHFSRTCADESTDNIDKKPIQRDFSLKLHTAGKVDSSFSYHSKQSRTPIPNSAKDKYIGPLSRRAVKDDHENVQSSRVSSIVQSSLTKFVTVSKRTHDNSCTVLSEVPVLRNETARHQVRKISLEMCAGTSRSILDHNQMDDSSDINHDEPSASSREVHFSNEVENSLLAETNAQNGGSEEEDLEQNKSVPYIGDASDDLTGKNLESVPQVLSDTRKGNSDAQEDLEHQESVPHIDDCTDALTGKNLETMPQVLSCIDPNKETLDTQEDLEHKKWVPCIDDSTDALTNKNFESIPQVLSSADPNALSSDVPRLFSGPVTCSVLQFNMKDLKMSRQKRLSILKSGFTREKMKIKSRCYNAATLELSQPENEERKAKTLAAATTELERLFNKEDFDRMKVIGQFNLGFIIGRIDWDLFIIDQHAADEKYNFERLSESTILNQQPLLKPMRLELSPEEEIVASMHMDIIRKNGFSLVEDMHAPPGHHFRLSAVPFSKNITFGAEDVKELISTLSDSQGDCMMLSCYKMDTKDSICPSRVRGMLASRACRSSVMIGDALGKNQMEKILKNLAQLKSPWNCPHGRPTMRHLIDLTTILKNEQEEDLNID